MTFPLKYAKHIDLFHFNLFFCVGLGKDFQQKLPLFLHVRQTFLLNVLK